MKKVNDNDRNTGADAGADRTDRESERNIPVRIGKVKGTCRYSITGYTVPGTVEYDDSNLKNFIIWTVYGQK